MLCLETFPVGTLACNCSVLYSPRSHEALIIDPGFDPQPVMQRLSQLNLKPVACLHTHAHVDHIGGSQELNKALGVPLYLHIQDFELYEALPWQGQFLGVHLEKPRPIENTLEDEQTFGFAEAAIQDPSLGAVLQTLHTPGHTPGSCSFFCHLPEGPVLFSGDTLFHQSVGRTDLPGGDFDTLAQSIQRRLYCLPEETRCIPGHGPETRIFEEKRHNPFVRAR